jgi:hypothetical protein
MRGVERRHRRGLKSLSWVTGPGVVSKVAIGVKCELGMTEEPRR